MEHVHHVLPATGYVRARQLLGNILPIGRTTLWRMVQSGRFPAPVRLGPNITAWRVEDVRDWMNRQQGEGSRDVA